MKKHSSSKSRAYSILLSLIVLLDSFAYYEICKQFKEEIDLTPPEFKILLSLGIFAGLFLLAIPLLLLFKKIGLVTQVTNWIESINNAESEFKKNRKYKLVQRIAKAYQIQEIRAHHKAGAYLVFFNKSLIKKALPVITIGNTELPVQIYGSHAARIHIKDFINSKLEIIVLSCGGQEHCMYNPFFLSGEEPVVRWQNQGHVDEKAIYLKSKFFKYPVEHIYYDFDLLIGNVLKGTFTGCLSSENPEEIVMPIGTVTKSECNGKKCTLRLNIDKSIKILLPEPEIFSVNHEEVIRR